MAPTRSFSLLLPVLLSTATAFRLPVTPKLFLKAPFSSFESEISGSTIDKVQKPPTVFVGNLPFAASEADIRSMITESIGDICTSFRVPIDRETGRHRGFAYLEFSEQSVAEQASDSLQGKKIMDRDIRVEVQDPSAPPKSRKPSAASTPTQDVSIYLGNLDFNTAESDIIGLCDSQVGQGKVLKVRIHMDRETGKPKGFAHVDFTDSETAEKAVEALRGAELLGRPLRVDHAQRRDDKSTPRTFADRRNTEQHSVFIGNLAWDMTKDLVEDMLTDVLGPNLFTKVRLATDRDTGKLKGFGHVDFKDAATAERAIQELNGMEVLGRQLRVDHASRDTGAPGGDRPRSQGRGGDERSPRSGRDGGRYENRNDQDNYGSW